MVLNFAACWRTSPPCRKSTDEFNDFPLAQRELHTGDQVSLGVIPTEDMDLVFIPGTDVREP